MQSGKTSLDEQIKLHQRRQKTLQRHGMGKTRREDKLLYTLWTKYHCSMVRYLQAMQKFEAAPRYSEQSMPSKPSRPDVDEPDQDSR
jgi:hypothetical protein